MPRHPELVAALAGLPGVTTARLAKLLDGVEVDEAWARVMAGRASSDVAEASVRAEWRAAAGDVDLEALGARLRALGCTATSWHDDEHPRRFVHDIDPAPVAFRLGRLPPADLPRVAIVGTRRASGIGREIARELGMGLAEAGVIVVSGLALGVDGAAHHGALLAADGAPPAAVVGSGVDVPYPAAHRSLWADVATAGCLLAEAPLGARPDAWRFPARNRLIVALSDLVVVVESRAAGGSLLTVEEAIRRGVDVMAVPGSLRNGAAVGTNQLLADGCAPVRDVDDVTTALGLDTSRTGGGASSSVDPGDAAGAEVLEAVDDGPTSLDEIVERTGWSVGEVSAELSRLELRGLVVADGVRVRRA
ncbi:MAG: DNA-processing protein DprA [Acidimicrobiales bacterium]|nr:DNA-processing protein DprA [Acidimicrobiales bacterium]